MGKIRVASAMPNSMKDAASQGLRRDPGSGSQRPLPATGGGYRDLETDTGVHSGQAPDSSRSRGYGRYEI